MKRSITTGVIALGLLTTVVFASANEKPPSHNEIFTKFGSQFNKQELIVAGKQEKTTKIEKTIADQGIVLTINGLYKNKKSIFLAYTINTKKEFDYNTSAFWSKPNVYINKKEVNHGGLEDLKVSDDKYIGIIEVNPEGRLPSNANIKFTIHEIFETKGNWTIEFPLK